MVERNESRYQLEQDNKIFILKTSLINDKIKLVCQDSNAQIFDGIFSLPELIKISRYFQPTHTIEQIQGYLNGIIERQRVGIEQNGVAISLVLYLINNDKISIPLLKKSDNLIDINNYNIPSTNYESNPSNQYYKANSGNIQTHYFNQKYLGLNQNPNQIQNRQYYGNTMQKKENIMNQRRDTGIPGIQGVNTQNKKPNQLASSPNGVLYPQADASQNYSYQYDEKKKIGKLEDDTNIIRVGQEKLRNDMKRVLEEASKLKEQNQIYKTDHDNLTNENNILKNENENYKKQIITFQNEIKGIQEENNTLKNQIVLLNKDVDAFESQNNEIRKMYEDLENENNILKNENENYKKQILTLPNEIKGIQEENNTLKNQVDLLNKDVDAFENQNNEIRKMYEDLENENNIYRSQVEELNKENELLRGQIEELNNNFTLINNELENIKNENNAFRTNNIAQNNKENEDLINKLVEENNMYKQKAQENEILKHKIEELQYHLQMNRERHEDMDQDQDQEKEVKGDIIHDIKELEMITKKINKDENKKIIINLLYKASIDSDKASVFHEKCDKANNTIVLVETKNGKRFGGYTTCSWSGNCVDKSDPEAFIFSFDKMKTYDNIPGDDAIGCYPKFGPIFLGCQIKIFDNAFIKGGTTFEKELNFNTEEDYELTGGDRVFEVKDIEVYEVIFE